jgi:hypothetical protein
VNVGRDHAERVGRVDQRDGRIAQAVHEQPLPVLVAVGSERLEG